MVIESSQTTVDKVIIHSVGNPTRGEDLFLSDQLISLEEDDVRELLSQYFLGSFQLPEFNSLTSAEDDFELNPFYPWANELFQDQTGFVPISQKIAKYLFDITQHQNIKSGDLFVTVLSNLLVQGVMVNAIGIFKCENKEHFLKLKNKRTYFELSAQEGISVKRVDKGCLILNWDKESGYRVLSVDGTNGFEADYWYRDFLNLKPWSDSYHHTEQFLQLTRDYLSEQMQDEFKASRADQIDLLNRSVNYFKTRDRFDQQEFESEVLADENVIESFRRFGDEVRQQSNFDIIDHFEISAPAVKRQAKIFKSVLKLDKNFHVPLKR